MGEAREESDPRSHKRQALDSASMPGVSAARAVAEMDDAIWTTIVEFLPIPRDLEVSEDKQHEAAVAEVATAWQTLLHLRFVSKKLAALLHPRENAALWRRLVLQSFDFSTQPGFNAENFIEEHGLDIPSDEENEGGETGEASEQNPQLEAMRGRYHDMPPNYLDEDIVSWEALGIYHSPSQYGFLTSLQQKPPEGKWPESEDPFTLFGDLVRLLQLPSGDAMSTCGEGSSECYKYLAAPAEADSSSAFHRFYVMKTLGYVPHFWDWGRGIGEKWKGFTEPDAFEKAIAEQMACEDVEEDPGFGEEEAFDFPGCSVGDAKRLHRHIRQHCRDWRSVCCNTGSDGETPVFFVGESKAAPHRWTGYVGLKCWT
jgi:hypothetical protein